MKTTKTNEPKFSRRSYVGQWVMGILIFLLFLSLLLCGVSLAKTSKQIESLGAQVTSQQQMIDDLSRDLSSADSTIKEQESAISGLESAVKAKDKSISSYKKEMSELTEKYNKLLETKGKKTAAASSTKAESSAPKKYATVAVSEKTCYLTFDDGPSDNTLKILDVLKQYNVKATFFVIGTNKLSYVKRIHEEGHTVALHSYSHNYSQIYRSQKAYFEDLQKISDVVEGYIGIAPKVIRFPGGASNTVSRSYCKGIMTALSKETLNRGYVYFDWNVDSTDASGNNVAVSKIMKNIKTYGGRNKQDVVLMHDTDAKDTTVEALPQIIEYYIGKGYTFAPLTTSTPPVTHGVNN